MIVLLEYFAALSEAPTYYFNEMAEPCSPQIRSSGCHVIITDNGSRLTTKQAARGHCSSGMRIEASLLTL